MLDTRTWRCTNLPGRSADRARDSVDSEAERIDRHGLVRVVDQGEGLEILRKREWQVAVRLDSCAREESRVGDSRLEHRHWHALGIQLPEDLGQRLVEG